MAGKSKLIEDWYWASDNTNGDAGNRFIIANGQEPFFARVRREFGHEAVSWMPIHNGRPRPNIGDILEIVLTVVQRRGINYNRFLLEAAQIPVFAKFIYDFGYSIQDFVGIPNIDDKEAKWGITNDQTNKLERVIAEALNLPANWHSSRY